MSTLEQALAHTRRWPLVLCLHGPWNYLMSHIKMQNPWVSHAPRFRTDSVVVERMGTWNCWASETVVRTGEKRRISHRAPAPPTPSSSSRSLWFPGRQPASTAIQEKMDYHGLGAGGGRVGTLSQTCGWGKAAALRKGPVIHHAPRLSTPLLAGGYRGRVVER